MTPRHALLLVLIPLAYLAGSIPFGLIVGMSKGIDPRKAGSGNIGATNVGRLLGGKFFALVFTLDLLKGFIPTFVASLVIFGQSLLTRRDYMLWLLVGFAAIVGHMFSIFLKLRGGKGVATSAGVLLGVFPFFTLPGVIAVLGWLITFNYWRYVSLASIVGAALFPIAYVALGLGIGWPIFREQLPLTVFAFLVAALMIYKHRSNIARLRAGTESRFASKSRSEPSAE